MKKLVLNIFLFVTLFSSSTVVLAKDAGADPDARTRPKRPPRVSSKYRSTSADANSPRGYRQTRPHRNRDEERALREVRRKERDRLRQIRMKEREKMMKVRDPNAARAGKGKSKGIGKAKGAGKGKQLKSLEKQMKREKAKHLKRTARLERIRELAGDDSKKLERIDKLIQKELMRYEMKQQRMNMDKQIRTRGGKRKPQAGDDVNKPKKKTRQYIRREGQEKMGRRPTRTRRKAVNKEP